MPLSNMIRVRYSEGETGWAEDLGEGKIKIANCPLTPNLRMGDICSTVARDGWTVVDKILEREFPHTAIIWYPETKYWYLIRGASLIKGWKTEGGVAPKDGREGFLSINYKGDESDLEAFLKQLYIEDQVRISRPSDEEFKDDEEFEDDE